ncbi:MAG: non-heme iron oxygenase ferredoxin subunit [candidate division Zixibacteria bacterium]
MADEFKMLCTENEIAEGTVKTFKVEDKAIVVARYEGVLYALDNICTHDEGELGAGDVVKGQIQCPRHGARFDLKTGNATQMPAVMGIKTYRIKIENGDILVALSD